MSETRPGPVLYLIKDIEEKVVGTGCFPTLAEMWQYAQQTLMEHEDVKRIVFYTANFSWINALARPGFLKSEQDQLSQQERKMLQHVLEEQ